MTAALILYPARATVLRAVRALLTPPEAWTTGSYARNFWGHPCGVFDPSARCWCLEGAVARVTGSCWGEGPINVRRKGPYRSGEALINHREMRELERLLPPTPSFGNKHLNPANFNDSSTHAKILRLLDRAIAKVEST